MKKQSLSSGNSGSRPPSRLKPFCNRWNGIKTVMFAVFGLGGLFAPIQPVQAQWLYSVNADNTVTIVGWMGSYEYDGDLVIPSTWDGLPVSSVGNYMCDSYPYLTGVTIPGSVTSIGIDVFQDCGSLASVTLGNGLTNIGNYSFAGCANLTSIYFFGNAPTIDPNGNVFANAPATVYYWPGTIGWSNTFAGLPVEPIPTGSLQVTIIPAAAIAASAQWQVDGGTNQNSGATVTNLSVGEHTVSFSTINGWITPANQTVPVSNNSTAIATGAYIAYPAVQATANAVLTNGFVVGVNITDCGYGYTNTPNVTMIGGGGTGAQAVAVVSNEMVIAVNVLDTGSDYTNIPVVVIDPPFITNPHLGIAPMSFLTFTNLTLAGVYQLQQAVQWYWTNQSANFTATNAIYTQLVSGVVSSGDFRLALNPVPAQAFAVAEVVNGFVVGATLTSGGSGYVTSPPVTIIGGGGTNATAVSQISGGVVTNINMTSTGTGYTNTPTVEIGQPPAAAVSPTVLQVIRLDSASLAPYDNYQIQVTQALGLGATWGNWNGGLFSPTAVTNSQYLFVTNGTGFFRLQYVP